MTDKIIQEKYLALLRTATGLATPSADMKITAKELPEILRLSRMQGTGPLVYNELLKNLPSVSSSKEEGGLLQQVMQMKQVCMQNMMLQEAWEKIIARVWNALSLHHSPSEKHEDKPVQAILMKGFAYAQLYPLPYLRSWGDLDVWVGPEQYHKACGILREAFPEAKHHDEEWDELKHYCFVFDNGMAIELHRVSMDCLSPSDQTYICRLEKESAMHGSSFQIQDIRIVTFEAKYDLLFCFMHSWEHFCGSGIPLKQVCDMALLVRKARSAMPDWNELESYMEKHLKALKLLEVWRYYGYMACKSLGLSLCDWPLLQPDSSAAIPADVVKYGERLYEQVMKEGQCRLHDYGDSADRYEAREKARQMNVLARKWLTLKGRIEKARFLEYFAPQYARYVLLQEVKKGIRRTIRREEMINY